MSQGSTLTITNVKHRTHRHNLRTPFVLSGGRKMTHLTYLDVTVTANVQGHETSIFGRGGGTMANLWAGVELDAMVDHHADMADILSRLGRKPMHPLALYELCQQELAAKAAEWELTEAGYKVAFAGFDLAVFDAFGKALKLHPVHTLLDQHLGDALLKSRFNGTGFGRIIHDEPVNTMELLYTHGIGGRLIPMIGADGPNDDRPANVEDWFKRQGRRTVKVKADADNMVTVREFLALEAILKEPYYTIDFNGGCASVAQLEELLTLLERFCPAAYSRLRMLEQPFKPDLTFSGDAYKVDAIAKRKPVWIDESALTVEAVRKAKQYGYTGVVVKVGKGFSDTMLLAREATLLGMEFMVHDLTNLELSTLASWGTAAHLKGWMHGLESNSVQFASDWRRGFPKAFSAVKIDGGEVDTRIFGEGGGFYANSL